MQNWLTGSENRKGIRHRDKQQQEAKTTPWSKGKWGDSGVSGIRESLRNEEGLPGRSWGYGGAERETETFSQPSYSLFSFNLL